MTRYNGTHRRKINHLLKCDSVCLLFKGLDKGAAPPPPDPASQPRTPSEEERVESVNLDMDGFNISQVNILEHRYLMYPLYEFTPFIEPLIILTKHILGSQV